MRMPRSDWRWRLLALATLLTVAVTWLWAHEGHEPLPTRGAKVLKNDKGQVTGVLLSREAQEALDVRTAEVVEHPFQDRLLAYATVTAPWQQHAYASSRLPGRIVKLHVRPGETVEAGRVLAEVQSLELESLQLELLKARNDEQLSGKVGAELEASARQGAVPAQTLLDAQVKHRQNINALEVTRGKWLGLGLPIADLDRLFERGKPVVDTIPIASPIRGTVVHADLSVGKVVDRAEHLFEVIDLSGVWVRIGVLERDLHRVAEGQDVELSLTAHPGRTFEAKVTLKEPHLDAASHLNTVWARLTNPTEGEPAFLPGMTGQARLLADKSAARTVPVSALIHDGVEPYVLVERARTADGSEFLRVPVVVGRRTVDNIEILGGDVYAGSFVVTRGSHELASLFVPGVLRLSPEGIRAADIRFETVGQHVVEDVIEVEGAIEVPPDRRAAVASQLSGTVQRILVERGQEVQAGDEIARIASLEFQDLQLELLETHLDTELLESSLTRLRAAEKSVAARVLWETESRRDASRDRRDTLKRKLESAGLSAGQLDALIKEKKPVDHLPVRAPIAGRVVRFDKVLGQSVRTEEPLFEIHDLSDPLVQVYLAEDDMRHIRVGQRARVRLTADPAFLADGTVVRSARVFEPDSRTLSAWIKLDRAPSPPLLHRQLARVTLVRERRAEALAVPLGAIVREGPRAFVFVQNKDGTFERRSVETGAADDRRVQVLHGLAARERLAFSGASALQTAYASIR